MLDEWGEEIENIQDSGVFSDTSLGATEPPPQSQPGTAMRQGFPDTMPTQFPYAPTPGRVIHQVGPNRYGLYQNQGPVVQSGFPGCPIRPAGMGAVDLDFALYPQTGSPSTEPNYDWLAQTGGLPSGFSETSGSGLTSAQRAQAGVGIASSILDAVGGAVGQGFNIASSWQQSQQQMQQQQQQFQAQMALLNTRIAEMRASGQQERMLQLEQLRAQLDSANASGDSAALAALLAQSRSATRSTWVTVGLIVGGVAVLGLGGIILWKVLD